MGRTSAELVEKPRCWWVFRKPQHLSGFLLSLFGWLLPCVCTLKWKAPLWASKTQNMKVGAVWNGLQQSCHCASRKRLCLLVHIESTCSHLARNTSNAANSVQHVFSLEVDWSLCICFSKGDASPLKTWPGHTKLSIISWKYKHCNYSYNCIHCVYTYIFIYP